MRVQHISYQHSLYNQLNALPADRKLHSQVSSDERRPCKQPPGSLQNDQVPQWATIMIKLVSWQDTNTDLEVKETEAPDESHDSDECNLASRPLTEVCLQSFLPHHHQHKVYSSEHSEIELQQSADPLETCNNVRFEVVKNVTFSKQSAVIATTVLHENCTRRTRQTWLSLTSPLPFPCILPLVPNVLSI